jgi:apolipoprotein D and lipocalin family protein
MKKVSSTLTLLCIMFSFFGCGSSSDLPVVASVDINKYAGKWYEIASFPISAQKGCSCTTAEYTVTKEGYITVYNRCLKNGEVSDITGKAFPVEGSGNAKLKVQFFWPFKADYWIIDLDKEYQYAVVGHPSRDYLWILSRTPIMNDSTYSAITTRVKNLGYDLSRLKKTTHI